MDLVGHRADIYPLPDIVRTKWCGRIVPTACRLRHCLQTAPALDHYQSTMTNRESRIKRYQEPMLPRKDIGMRREWIAAALAKIAPTFRFGPLLVDPKRVRMPVATEIAGTWSWDHRADISKWQEDPIINSTDDAIIPPDPVEGTEGWLRLAPPTETGSGQTGP